MLKKTNKMWLLYVSPVSCLADSCEFSREISIAMDDKMVEVKPTT